MTRQSGYGKLLQQCRLAVDQLDQQARIRKSRHPSITVLPSVSVNLGGDNIVCSYGDCSSLLYVITLSYSYLFIRLVQTSFPEFFRRFVRSRYIDLHTPVIVNVIQSLPSHSTPFLKLACTYVKQQRCQPAGSPSQLRY